MAGCILATTRPRATITGPKEYQIYVGALPLRATRGPAQLLMSSAYTLNLWDFQHFLVFIKSKSLTSHTHSQVVVYDFQPKDPENIYTALTVLSGRPVPGAVLIRKQNNLPRSRCWFVGSPNVDAIDVATRFSNSWKTDLRVGYHDCRDYTNGLVELLTGEKLVLERLRRNMASLA